jgi:hypothetical protein
MNILTNIANNFLDKNDIIHIDSSIEKKILELPHGKKLLSKRQKIVYIDANCTVFNKKYVFKGPYDINDIHLYHYIRNCATLLFLEKEFDTKNFCLKIEKILINNINQIYLVFQYIGFELAESDIEVYSSKLESNVKIIKKNTVIYRISDITFLIDDNLIIDSLQYLYFLYLLNIDDYGFHNILLQEDEIGTEQDYIKGIDFDEMRLIQEYNTEFEKYIKNPSKQNIKIISPFLKTIKKINFNNNIKMKLKELNWSDNEISNIENKFKY